MKLSISLPDDDVEALDRFVSSAGLPSRSAGLRRAIQLLRHPELEDDYAAAWADWETSGDADAWEGAVADGLADAPR